MPSNSLSFVDKPSQAPGTQLLGPSHRRCRVGTSKTIRGRALVTVVPTNPKFNSQVLLVLVLDLVPDVLTGSSAGIGTQFCHRNHSRTMISLRCSPSPADDDRALFLLVWFRSVHLAAMI